METAILPASPRLQFPHREKLSNSTILPFEIDSPPTYDARERYVKFDFLANWSADHELPFRERIRQLFPGNWTGERQPGRRIFDSPMVNETALLPVTEPDGGRPSLPFQMSLHLEVIWSVAFIVLIVGACVGNVLVIMIILGNRRMKTTTNYFLLNLSGADLSMAIFNCTFNFFYMLKSHWPFGTAYCVVSQFIAHVSLAASAFTLAVISFDRILNVIRPLKPSMSRSGCRLLLFGTWLVSALLAAPILPYATTIYSSESGRINCVIAWPDGLAMRSRTDYVYNVMILVVTYLAPMFAMIICYAIIGFKLFAWGSNQPAHQDNNIRRKKKVVQMLALLVVIFGLCWLPYHTYFIVVHHHPEFSTRPYVNHIYLAFYWLAMSNALINPIVYYLLDARFRYFFSHLLIGAKESLEKCMGLDQSPSQYSESHDLFAIPLPEVGARGGNSTHRAALPSSGVIDNERHTTEPSCKV